MSSGISTCNLYGSTGVTELHSYEYGCWQKLQDFDIFCHLLCCPSHIDLFIREGDKTSSSCTKLIWPILSPCSGGKQSHSIKATRKKLHHIHKTRHIPKQGMRWYGDPISFSLLGFLSSPLLLNISEHWLRSLLLKGRSCHSHKSDVVLGLSWTSSDRRHWDVQTKALNFLQRIHSTAERSGWHLLICIQTDKATKEVCEATDLCWGK